MLVRLVQLVQLVTSLDSGTQNENEMQIWTQRITDKTNKEVTNLRKEMVEKLEKILKEMKNNRRTQSVPNRRYREKKHSQSRNLEIHK